MSERFKNNNATRGGVYKRRGRPGRKFAQMKSSEASEVGDIEMEALKRTEADVGITEYIGAHKGFSAVIKQRYSDFHVSEINQEGKLVELTSLSCDIENLAPKPSGKEATLDDCNDLLPEVKDKLQQMEKSDFSNVEIEVTDMSKDERKRIHEIIKNVFGTRVVSNTVEKEGKKIMVIGKPKGKQRVDDWSQGKGRYVYFVLYKENLDTMEAANIISHKLRLTPGKVTYAGTKDRRGKTTQLACVPHIHPKKLAEINSAVRNITVGNFSIHKNPLRLGDLRGNRFRIALRNVTASDDDLEEASSTLKERGFINYYGLQRFGSTSVPTHHIGRALLRSDWKEAIELILKPRAQVAVHSKFKKPGYSLEESLAKARKIWWEKRDAHAALQALGNKPRGIEGQLLFGLKRNKPNDLVNALEGISLNTRLIYLHSYQSYVWNHVVSRRLKEFGYKPIVGDLMFDESDDLDEVPETIDELLIENEEIAMDSQENENKEEGSSSVSQSHESSDVSKPNNSSKKSRKQKVKVLTEEDVQSAKMTDIVLPLPGYDVTYPNNIVAEWYEEILKTDGLSSASLKQSVRKYSLSGSYRKVICHPKDFSWSSVQYNDPTVELIQSDLQKLKGENIPERVEDGSYKAVILDFCLPPSSYATMLLRDLLKCDTSTHHQMTLNNYFGGTVGAKREGEKCDDNEREAKVPKLEDEGKSNEDTSHKVETMDVENMVVETEQVKESPKEDVIMDSNHKDGVMENVSDKSTERHENEESVSEENNGDKAEDLSIRKENTKP